MEIREEAREEVGWGGRVETEGEVVVEEEEEEVVVVVVGSGVTITAVDLSYSQS